MEVFNFCFLSTTEFVTDLEKADDASGAFEDRKEGTIQGQDGMRKERPVD